MVASSPFAARSRVFALLALLAQIGELARRLKDNDDYENEIFPILVHVCACEPTSFWRENLTAIVILVSDPLRSGEDFTSFNRNKRTNCCGEKKYNHDAFNQSIIYFNTLRQRAKKLDQNTNVYK